MKRFILISFGLFLSACAPDSRVSGPNNAYRPAADSGPGLGPPSDSGRLDGMSRRADAGFAADVSSEPNATDAGDGGPSVIVDAGFSNNADAATGLADSGMSAVPDPGPAVLNPGWIGGPCTSVADCPFAGAECKSMASGFPGGMCTQSCDRFCPDQTANLNSVTFCIEDDLATPDGLCVSRCDHTLSPTGCRQGYVCLPEKRMNQSSVVRDVCVPRSGLPNRVTPPFDIGVACVDNSACERSACIEGLPGGYCTQEACNIVGCPSGSACFRLGQADYYACLKTCTNSAQCRQSENYQCDAQNVCWHVPPTRPACDLSGGAAACARHSAMASNDFVVIKKSTRSLTHCRGATEVNSYCMGLGGSPVLDKEQEGDQKTPEGVFYIPRLIPNSQYYKAFLISYPDNADAARGLQAGLITQSEHDAIIAAQAARREPPQQTNLGGLIEIHGRGSSSDWTWGCIAIEDTAIDALWPNLGVGDTVVIEH
jgi:hypothetical protein